MKLVEWNIHKMTNNTNVKPFVINSLLSKNADIICLVEYLTDDNIANSLDNDYWCIESKTESGNKVFIAVKKDFAPDGITVINSDEKSGCYNFLHIDFLSLDNEKYSIIGVRMLSPIDAEKQTPPLKDYLNKISNTYICTGDFNIKTFRMNKWFPGIEIEKINLQSEEMSNNSIIYIDKNSKKVNGFGAVDHILHSDDITVSANYDWNFIKLDSHYPSEINAGITAWDIKAAYPDHAIMVANIDKK